MSNSAQARPTAGFTLVEVMLAIAIGGMLLATIHQVVVVTSDTAATMAQFIARNDQERNGRRWLRAALASIESPVGKEAFIGQPSEMEFTSWTLRGGGWYGRERIWLHVRDRRLVAERSTSGQLVLADSVSAVVFDYSLPSSSPMRWGHEWISEAALPLAVQIRLFRSREAGAVDTVLVPLREPL